MKRTARLGRFCGLIVLASYALLGQEDSSIAGIEGDGAQLAEQLQRVHTVATNRSMAPDKVSARVAAVAELSVLTNTSTAKLSIPESTEEPPRRPAPRWIAGFDKKFVAENSFVRASVEDDVSELGALKVTLPTQAGSREVRSSIVGLAFCEAGENGRTVLIAQVKPTKAQLLADERIITFRNAFSGEGVMADLVYELTDASLAQDVVIRGRLPEPERFGLSADSYLAMVTEFHDAPPPKQWAARKGEFDRTLQWGTAGIVRGKAFSLGEGARSTVDVQKMWVEQDGRTLLYETVPYPWIKEAVNALPAAEDSSATEAMPLDIPEGDEQGGVESRGSAGNLLSALPTPILPRFQSHRTAPPAKPLGELAALGGRGFVLDFTLVDYPVISVDFGADYDEKRGYAAIGRSSFDYWNVYDVENAVKTNRWFKDGMSLLYNDQSVAGASVKVENAPGAWSSKNWMQSLDPAYDDYIYPISGEAEITISSLPAGFL